MQKTASCLSNYLSQEKYVINSNSRTEGSKGTELDLQFSHLPSLELLLPGLTHSHPKLDLQPIRL